MSMQSREVQRFWFDLSSGVKNFYLGRHSGDQDMAELDAYRSATDVLNHTFDQNPHLFALAPSV